MTPTIRKAALHDVPRLHHLIQAHAVFEGSTAPLTIDQLATLVLTRPKPIRFLVAACDGDLTGYAAVTFDWSAWRGRRYAHLDCLFVAENRRGSGIGRHLFAKAEAIASAEGADRLEWQTPAWNEPARRFYIREGAAFQPKLRFTVLVPRATDQRSPLGQ